MSLIGVLNDMPVVHTFTDLSDSWGAKAHVASRIELVDVDRYAYVNYLTVFKPDDLIYAGYHKRGANEDIDGFYSGSVWKGNYLWQLRKDYPASDFMLIVYAGFDSLDESMDEEYERIGLLWDSVGKHKEGGRCLNLARYREHFHYDPTGSTRSAETKAKLSKSKIGVNNGMFGVPKPEGAGVPPRPVIRTDTGQIFESLAEAALVEGVAGHSTIGHRIRNKSFNGIWQFLDEYQASQKNVTD